MRTLIENELKALRENLAAVALFLIISLATVFLTNELWTRPAPSKVALIDTESRCTNNALLKALVVDQPYLKLVSIPDTKVSTMPVWTAIDQYRLDILIVCDPAASDLPSKWIAYASFRNDADRERAVSALKLVEFGLGYKSPWYLADANPLPPPPPPPIPTPREPAGRDASASPPPPPPPNEPSDTKASATTEDKIYIHTYPGLSVQGSTWLIPAIALMVSLLLSFYLSATSVIREIVLGTWNQLRLAPNVTVLRLIVGKSALPMVLSLVSLALYSVLGIFVGVSVKPQLGLLSLVVYLPAVFGATMQGLAVSTLVKNETAAQFCAAAYLIGMFMFAGAFVPNNWSGPTVQAIGSIFPLSYAILPAQSVILSGGGLWPYMPEILRLFALDAAFAALAIGLVSWRFHRA